MKVKETKIKAKFQNVYESSKPKPTILERLFLKH